MEFRDEMVEDLVYVMVKFQDPMMLELIDAMVEFTERSKYMGAERFCDLREDAGVDYIDLDENDLRW